MCGEEQDTRRQRRTPLNPESDTRLSVLSRDEVRHFSPRDHDSGAAHRVPETLQAATSRLPGREGVPRGAQCSRAGTVHGTRESCLPSRASAQGVHSPGRPRSTGGNSVSSSPPEVPQLSCPGVCHAKQSRKERKRHVETTPVFPSLPWCPQSLDQ